MTITLWRAFWCCLFFSVFLVPLVAEEKGKKTKEEQKNGVLKELELTAITTLEEALQSAFSTNAKLRSSVFQEQAKSTGINKAMSAFVPNLDASATRGASVEGKESTSDFFRSSSYDNRYPNDWRYEVGARWNIFNFGADTARLMAAKEEAGVAEVDRKSAEQKLIIDVAEAYLNVIKAKEGVAVTGKFEQQAAHSFKRVQTEYTVGHSTRTNVLTAKSELALATSDRIRSEAEYTVALYAFQQVVGRPAGDLKDPRPSLNVPATFDEAVVMAECCSLQLLRDTKAYRASRFALSSAFGPFLPSVSLGAKFANSHNDPRFQDPKYWRSEIGLTVSLNLFSGGKDFSDLRASHYGKESARFNLEHSRSDLKKNVAEAWHGLKSAKARHIQSQLAVEAYQNAYEGAEEEFRLGQRAYLDLLKVQQQKLKADLGFIESKKQEVLSLFKLNAVIGTLSPETLGIKWDYQ